MKTLLSSGMRLLLSALLLSLVALSIVYLSLLVVYHETVPAELIRLVTNDTWTVDSATVIRDLYYDYRDRNKPHRAGFCSYAFIIYAHNNSLHPFTIDSVSLLDRLNHLLIRQARRHNYAPTLTSAEDIGTSLVNRVISRGMRFVVKTEFRDSSQSLLAQLKPAPIDQFFESKLFALRVYSSREPKIVNVARYSSRDYGCAADYQEGWIFPTCTSLSKQARSLLDSNPDSSLVLFQEALRIDSTFWDAYRGLASIHFRRGDDHRAASIIADYLAIDSHDPIAVKLLACLRDRLGEKDVAVRLYLKAVAIYNAQITDGDSALYLQLNKAQAFIFAGFINEGHQALRAIRLTSEDDSLFYREVMATKKEDFVLQVLHDH